MSKKLSCPTPITAEDVEDVFRKNGFRIVAKPEISVDVIDTIVPLLQMLQAVQLWGELCTVNDIKLAPHLEGDLLGISVHSAQKGQRVGVVPFRNLKEALNMPKTWLESVRHYGTDPGMRRERLDDDDLVQISNEVLDGQARTMLQLLSLLLPPTSSSETGQPPDKPAPMDEAS